MSPLQRKGLLFRTFLAQLEGLAASGAVLIVLEDAHWLDPTSRELFDQIVDRLQRLPVLLVVTFRPDLSPPWIGFPHVTLLTINRLSEAQTRSLVARVTGGKALPSAVLEQILTRTEGVPLFTEELTKTVLESGFLSDVGDHYVLAGPLPPLAIPATLHDSLMARLDRLAPVKEVDRWAPVSAGSLITNCSPPLFPCQRPTFKWRSIDWSLPSLFSAAALLRQPPTSSSMRWSEMQLMKVCSGSDGRTFTLA
jgi:predicted ATPase